MMKTIKNHKSNHPNIVSIIKIYEWQEKSKIQTIYYFAVVMPIAKYTL